MRSFQQFIIETGAVVGSATQTTKQALIQWRRIAGGRQIIQTSDATLQFVFAPTSPTDRVLFRSQYKQLLRTVLAPSPTWYDISQKLYPGQEDITPKFVVPFITTPNAHDDYDLPTIVQWRGREWVADGHHRFIAFRLLGISRCVVQIYKTNSDE